MKPSACWLASVASGEAVEPKPSPRASVPISTGRWDSSPVIKALARHHVTDVEATHPTLEEVFLGYYSEEARP